MAASGNTQNALAKLLSIGDIQGAQLIGNFASQQSRQNLSERQFQNLQQTQTPEYIGNVARTQAQVSQEFSPKTTNITTPSGETITVEKGPQGYRVPQIEGMSGERGNPFAPSGKQSEGQANASTYATRMLTAEKILRATEGISTNQSEVAKSKLPGAGTYYNLNSEDFQKFDQARRDFINATLRRESGAVISPSEFANAEQQYFPTPGNPPSVIEQKRRNRQNAISGIAAAAGPAFRPSATFGPGGELVPRQGGQPQSAAPSGSTDLGSVQRKAQDAINRGAPPQAVAKHLLDNGIDPSTIGLTW